MNAVNVLPAVVIVPVPIAFTVNAVYVLPLANVSELTFTVTVAGIQVLPVKFNVLNHELAAKVGILAPDVNARLGEFVLVAPMLPKVNVLVTDIAEVNPPVPEQEKFE